MTTVTIMQPAYLPWLGFFDRIEKSDVVIILDHVTIDKNTKTQFTNRNRIWSNTGSTWLTVPVQTKGSKQETPIHDIQVASNIKWQRKHTATLQAAYGKAPCFKDYAAPILDLISRDAPLLVDYLNPITDHLLECLGISRKILYSHDLAPQKQKAELVLELCQSCNASRYISGPFGRDYLDLALFREAGIEVVFHDYPHPEYTQRGEGFTSHLSVVDLLFNHGAEARDILISDPECLALS